MFVVLGVSAFGFAAFNGAVTSPGPLAKNMVFAVPKGAGARSIARRLESAGVVASQNLFMAHFLAESARRRLNRTSGPLQLKAGEYKIPAGASVQDVMALLEEGRSRPLFATFPEGMTSHAIVERLRRDTRLTGEIGVVPSEGALLPATYDVRSGMTRLQVLERMRLEQDKLIRRLWRNRSPDIAVQTPEAAIILASMVQREMGPNDDPERIASVFHNRLKRGMRLQSDPTIQYGIFGGAVNWGRPIYKSEIRKATAHNTYQIDGLPPTPICNPGKAALKAVLNPATTNDLYFVADGKGGHVFAETLAGHERNVREWRKIERAIRKRQREEAKRKAAEAATAKRAQLAAAPAVASAVPAARSVATVKVEPSRTAAAPAQVYEGPVPLPVRRPRTQ